MNRLRAFAVAAISLLTACSSSSINSPAPIPTSSSNPPGPSIQHVIIMFQENRSLNSMFMNFPGAETVTQGPCVPYQLPGSKKTICNGSPSQRVVQLRQITLETCKCLGGTDIEHSHRTFLTEFNGGSMDGFDRINYGTNGSQAPAQFYPYAYVKRSEVQPYWDMASQYVLGDHMFSTATTDSFVAHQQLVAGTSALNSHESLTDIPSSIPWGCDNPDKRTTTGVIFKNGTYNDFGGPFPCLTQYRTMADVLDAAGVSWKYYVPSWDNYSPYVDFAGRVWNAFEAIKAVRYGPDWNTSISIPNTTIFKDIKNGTLPSVSWVIPKLADSDHPASGSNKGPSWVASVVNAVGKSQYWNNTAIIITWDEWGGFYDSVPPPQINYTSLGMRVPVIIVSPWAKRHYVSKTVYDFGSMLKFVEENFGTGSLGTSDVDANSLKDVFDFTQKPGKFKPFAAPYPESFFLHRPPEKHPDAVLDHDDGPPG